MSKKSPQHPVTTNLKEQSVDVRDEQILALRDQLARALADYSNLEKRFSNESSAVVKFATQSLLKRLLDVRDHLGMAATTGDASLKIILSTFDKILVDEGVTEIKADGVFDPHTMECQETVPGAKDQVIRLIRPGYLLHDRVLRPARVAVGYGQQDPKVSPAKKASAASV